MQQSLETLRDALFLGLILLLVIVLYKRLLRFLNKQETNDAYAGFINGGVRVEDGTLTVEFLLPEASVTKVELRNVDQKVVLLVHQGEMPAEAHSLTTDVAELPKGKYTCHLQTHNQHSSRAFTV